MRINIRYILLVLITTLFVLPAISQEKQKKIATIEFQVKGVCDMCKGRIENAAIIKGVKMAEWNKETEMLKVVYSTKKATIESIHNSIAMAGHDTDKVKANHKAYDKLPKCCAYKDENVHKH